MGREILILGSIWAALVKSELRKATLLGKGIVVGFHCVHDSSQFDLNSRLYLIIFSRSPWFSYGFAKLLMVFPLLGPIQQFSFLGHARHVFA